MKESRCDAGAFIIINNSKSKYFYVAAENYREAIKEHTDLLDIGQHQKAALQRDYTAQEGRGFSIMGIMQDIDIESAKHIVMTLLEVDAAAYNHE